MYECEILATHYHLVHDVLQDIRVLAKQTKKLQSALVKTGWYNRLT